MATRRSYQVSEVARITGVSVRALHHYDENGLLLPKERSDAGYRRYHDDDLLRLQQIFIGREQGLSLEEIRRSLHEGRLERDPRRADRHLCRRGRGPAGRTRTGFHRSATASPSAAGSTRAAPRCTRVSPTCGKPTGASPRTSTSTARASPRSSPPPWGRTRDAGTAEGAAAVREHVAAGGMRRAAATGGAAATRLTRGRTTPRTSAAARRRRSPPRAPRPRRRIEADVPARVHGRRQRPVTEAVVEGQSGRGAVRLEQDRHLLRVPQGGFARSRVRLEGERQALRPAPRRQRPLRERRRIVQEPLAGPAPDRPLEPQLGRVPPVAVLPGVDEAARRRGRGVTAPGRSPRPVRRVAWRRHSAAAARPRTTR
jgi:DNA-binding transcriptional MerR regulator